MSTPVAPPRIHHQGPPPGFVAIVYTVLFLAGLTPVTIFGGKPSFPGPWEPVATLMAFFQFGAAIALGILTASMVNQMRFLGVRAAGVNIALVGGLATALNMMGSAATLWALSQPGVAQDVGVTHALYEFSFALGGPGFSAPLGLLIAGLSIPALLMRRLPKWLTVCGIVLAICGELSWLNLMFPKLVFLVPLTRFPGFVWLIAAGFLLPRTITAGRGNGAARAAEEY